jgi:hypothetical protein
MLLEDEMNMNTKTGSGVRATSGRLAFYETETKTKRRRLHRPLALLTSSLGTTCALRRNFSHRDGGTILFQHCSPFDFCDPRPLITDH